MTRLAEDGSVTDIGCEGTGELGGRSDCFVDDQRSIRLVVQRNLTPETIRDDRDKAVTGPR
jgi:hypothetical protein